ncbi:hypothetical protein EON68_02165, partial [archaeon]
MYARPRRDDARARPADAVAAAAVMRPRVQAQPPAYWPAAMFSQLSRAARRWGLAEPSSGSEEGSTPDSGSTELPSPGPLAVAGDVLPVRSGSLGAPIEDVDVTASLSTRSCDAGDAVAAVHLSERAASGELEASRATRRASHVSQQQGASLEGTDHCAYSVPVAEACVEACAEACAAAAGDGIGVIACS